MAQAVTVYLAVILESWRSGERSAAENAAPLWLADASDAVAGLSAVGLLDDAGRIPERAWRSWFGPAHDRLADARLRGQIGGLMSNGLSRAEALMEAQRRLSKQPSSHPQASLNPTNQPTNQPSSQPSAPGKDGSLEERKKAWNDAHPNDPFPEKTP
jgi:hypothetical protein